MILTSTFRPAWWLPGPHLQTLWPVLDPLRPRPRLIRERLELPDGDFLELDWLPKGDGPLVMVIHGLEGSSRSGYARGLLAAVARRGWRAVVMHFRGTGGEPNRLARSYSAGESRDIAWVVETLRRRFPAVPLCCVGYSLGGNALLKWLGEAASRAPVTAAVAVSVPMLLEASARRMQQGCSRLYQFYLLRALRRSYRRKFHRRPDAPVPLEQVERLRDFYAFDDRITAPLHGYRGVDDYYRRASCRGSLRNIAVPTLILHALDDPFMTPEVVPEQGELSPAVTLELSRRGGHVGFVGGRVPGRGQYWLEQRIPAFLKKMLHDRFPQQPDPRDRITTRIPL